MESMNLEIFISEALATISAGVAQGRQRAQSYGVQIGQALYGNSDSPASTSKRTLPAIPEFIEFDMAVTVSTEGGGKAGIQVLGLALGKVEGQFKEETVSRIRFKIPVHWEEPKPQASLRMGVVSMG